MYYSQRGSQAAFDGGMLYGVILTTEVLRLTVSRILILLTALGLGIVIESVAKYQMQLILFAFAFVISLIASLELEHAHHEYMVGSAFISLVNGFVEILDLVLIFWILAAFARTTRYLKQENLIYKHQVVNSLFNWFIGCIVVAIILDLSVLFTRRTTANLDEYWKSLALWENKDFIIWTFYTVMSMYILKPDENSPKLEEINHLLDETLQEAAEPDRDGVELEKLETQEEIEDEE